MVFSEEEQRERWQVVMDPPGLMLSEDSGIEDDNEVIVVKSIPWCSEQVNDIFQQLGRRIQIDSHRKQHGRRRGGYLLLWLLPDQSQAHLVNIQHHLTLEHLEHLLILAYRKCTLK